MEIESMQVELDIKNTLIERRAFPLGMKDGDEYAVRLQNNIWHTVIVVDGQWLKWHSDNEVVDLHQVSAWALLE